MSRRNDRFSESVNSGHHHSYFPLQILGSLVTGRHAAKYRGDKVGGIKVDL